MYCESVCCSIRDKYFAAKLGENIVMNLSIGRSNDASLHQIHNQRDELKLMSNILCLERGTMLFLKALKHLFEVVSVSCFYVPL